MVWRRDAGFQLATFWTALSLTCSISAMVSPPGTPGGVPEVGGTVTVQGAFSAPLLSCYVGSSWIGQSVPIVQQVCTDHELTLPHLSLIPHLPYMSLSLLLVVSRLSCLCTYCHLPVYLSPCAAELNAQ